MAAAAAATTVPPTIQRQTSDAGSADCQCHPPCCCCEALWPGCVVWINEHATKTVTLSQYELQKQKLMQTGNVKIELMRQQNPHSGAKYKVDRTAETEQNFDVALQKIASGVSSVSVRDLSLEQIGKIAEAFQV